MYLSLSTCGFAKRLALLYGVGWFSHHCAAFERTLMALRRRTDIESSAMPACRVCTTSYDTAHAYLLGAGVSSFLAAKDAILHDLRRSLHFAHRLLEYEQA